MLIKAQFKIDLIQLKHTPDKEGLLNLHKEQAARELGAEIVKHFPFVKNEEGSYKGDVPEISMNRDHEFTDLYESRFFVMTEDNYYKLRSALIKLSEVDPRLSLPLQLLNK